MYLLIWLLVLAGKDTEHGHYSNMLILMFFEQYISLDVCPHWLYVRVT